MTTSHSLIDNALTADLELLSGGVSGASTYRVHGLAEACVLKLVAAQSADYVRERAYREIHFYEQLADRLPMHTPRVFASRIEASGACALLLAAYAPLKPANELQAADFAEIVRQLAQLHALYWNRTDQLTNFSWLATPIAHDYSYDVPHARTTWQTLALRPQFHEILTNTLLRDIETALAEISAQPEYVQDVALTLCHGDCHLDNLLRDNDDHLVWADWQEIRIGHGSDDLSFLIQRAEANGATVAHDTVVAVYCAALKDAGIEGVSERAIADAMYESERRTRLLYWPDYLGDVSKERMVQHVARIFRT